MLRSTLQSIREQVAEQYAAGVQAQLSAMSSDDLSAALSNVDAAVAELLSK